MQLNFNINVNVGITPQVEQLVRLILSSGATAKAVQAEAIEVQPTPHTKTTQEAVPVATPTPIQEEEQAPTPTPAETATVKHPTEADVRAAIERARIRIQGSDYKENAESEGNAKYKRKLTAYFKQLSAALGADKPSLITPENRQAFIEQCDTATIGADGNPTNEAPFQAYA